MNSWQRNRYIIIIIPCVLVFIGIIGIYIWRYNIQDKFLDDELASRMNWVRLKEQNEDSQMARSGKLSQLYSNEIYGFSFYHPDDFEKKEFTVDEGTIVVLFEKKDEKDGFQIIVSPFDEEEPLTTDRIRRDIPDIVIEQLQEITIGGEHALLFWSSDPVLGKTREVWFTHNNALYQISSYFVFDEMLSRIMATWQFNDNKTL